MVQNAKRKKGGKKVEGRKEKQEEREGRRKGEKRKEEVSSLWVNLGKRQP